MALFADVSEFQRPVDNSYTAAGYRFISFRSNDGTHQDANFLANYQWACAAADAGWITGFIVYFYWRTGDTGLNTHMAMVNAAGGPHPKMATMIDLESGGNPNSDQSQDLDYEYNTLATWLGNPARVTAYANSGDYWRMWPNPPAGLRWVGAGYPQSPNLPNQIAHQYTDGAANAGGLPMGAPPFGNCDMNSADNMTPEDLAAALGLGALLIPDLPGILLP
jgi:hypothetical protein